MSAQRVSLTAKDLKLIEDALVRYDNWCAGDFTGDGAEDYPGEFGVLARLQVKIGMARTRATPQPNQPAPTTEGASDDEESA